MPARREGTDCRLVPEYRHRTRCEQRSLAGPPAVLAGPWGHVPRRRPADAKGLFHRLRERIERSRHTRGATGARVGRAAHVDARITDRAARPARRRARDRARRLCRRPRLGGAHRGGSRWPSIVARRSRAARRAARRLARRVAFAGHGRAREHQRPGVRARSRRRPRGPALAGAVRGRRGSSSRSPVLLGDAMKVDVDVARGDCEQPQCAARSGGASRCTSRAPSRRRSRAATRSHGHRAARAGVSLLERRHGRSASRAGAARRAALRAARRTSSCASKAAECRRSSIARVTGSAGASSRRFRRTQRRWRARSCSARTTSPDADQRAFRRSGLAHLLAVSGMHLVLVVAAFVAALRALLVRIPALATRGRRRSASPRRSAFRSRGSTRTSRAAAARRSAPRG